jgi:hypothetical protein
MGPDETNWNSTQQTKMARSAATTVAPSIQWAWRGEEEMSGYKKIQLSCWITY